jgi:Zn-dependent peptidase ImmA (M78 family)
VSPTRTRESVTTNPSTPRGRAYDPWEHADRLGIEVVVRRLRTANGRWFPDYNTIALSDKLRTRDQRLVLSHEIGHGVLLHVDERPKHEKQADQFAARNLICPEELADLYGWARDERRIVAELGVTTTLFRAYVLSQAA